MLVNDSSSDNTYPYIVECIFFGVTSSVYRTAIICNIIILLPLLSFSLYYCLRSWLRGHGNASVSGLSHLDCFTLHMVVMELVTIFQCFVTLSSIFTWKFYLLKVGSEFLGFTWYGQGFFHMLTCMERYLAVVHPVTYLSLRNERGIRIRNVSIGCVWLLSFSAMGLMMDDDLFVIFDFIFLILFFAIITFCCLSVLCVLVRPGPGEQGEDKIKVDKSKQKAFYTIVAILGALVVRISWALAWIVAEVSGENIDCWMIISKFLVNCPSSLVLPLLFLHRKGKLVCCRD